MSGATTAFPAMTFAEADAILTAPGALFELEDATVLGVEMKVWKNALPTLREAFELGRGFGDRTFLVFEDERVSFDAFGRAALTLANALVARGVRKGDRVAIAARNLTEWPVAFYGAMLTGAIVTPLNAWWVGAELEYGLNDSGAKVLIADGERWDRIAPHRQACPALERVIVTRPAGPLAVGVERLQDLIGDWRAWAGLPPAPAPDLDIQPDDELSILFTSGTTGNPKGAVSTHRNIISGLMCGGYSAARTALRRGAAAPAAGTDGAQRANLLPLPFFHANACYLQFLPGLVTGTKQVLMRRWDAEEAFRLIERERVTSAGLVPVMAWQLAEHPSRAQYDLSSLQGVSWGGAPSAPELVQKVRAAFPGAGAGSGWGMTETSSGVTAHAAEDYERHPDSAGVLIPTWELKVTDPEGRPVPSGEVGELWAKGPGVIKGYWNKPQATAETFVDGWVRTGDLVRLDAENRLYVVDRAKDMLIRGGENIYCVEVENALHEHPEVLDAAVVPIPHKTLGEVPGAVVHARAGAVLDEAALRQFVAARIAAFKVPERVVFWPEPLPRNPTGKILKRDLRAIFAGS